MKREYSLAQLLLDVIVVREARTSGWGCHRGGRCVPSIVAEIVGCPRERALFDHSQVFLRFVLCCETVRVCGLLLLLLLVRD